ncbi:MAG TPA: winged helix-turn-helix domain-containing protein [Tahibacter sp.]|uniref:winged helix-turn-helix domain-containing protein n=1 Tax=Tahibacter sp. TaxID=2056211 RepID=UPI002D0EED22|nr:winged helix-turn-helix domain-containing protein [Tahibacter sp.]HSX61323.1 winged helix-turn-helix domain-containing protein [Tahibacter sp.]
MNTGTAPALEPTVPPRFRLGGWLVDAGSHELIADAGRQRLQPRQMQLLLRLAREPGTVLRREQLLGDVWEGRYVNDEALSRAIAELRQLLADDPRAPRYIETVPKLGYRLIAVPEPVADPPAAAAVPMPAPAPRRTAALDASGLPLADPQVRRRTQVTTLVVGAVVVALVALLAWILPQPPDAQQDAAALRSRVDRARPLATEPGFDQSGRFSRDGRWLAWSTSSADQNRAQIWIASRDGQSRRPLSDGDAWDMSPVFVDDDSAVVFVRYTANTCELREQKLIDVASRRIGECAPTPATSRIDASPDGRRIVFAKASGRGRTGLALLDRATGEVQTLTAPDDTALTDANPRFSADGSQLAFTRGQHSQQRLWLLPVAAPARARMLVEANGLLYGAAWLPGDTALVLAGDLFGYRALYRTDAATGALEFLGARGARYPDVAADGALLYEIADYQANLWRADLQHPQTPPVPITQSQRYNNQPAHSPDGRWLAFGSNRDGLEALYLAKPDGSGVQRLALDPRQRWVRPGWHPDGQHLLVTAILNRSDGTECLPYACSSEHSAIYRYDLAARQAVAVAGLGDDARYAQYSHDGRWIFFVRRVGEREQLWRAAADGRGAALLLDANVEHFTSDDRHLVLDIAAEPGLRICALDATGCRVVLDTPQPQTGLLPDNTYAALHGGKLAFVARDNSGARLVQRYDLAHGTIDTVLADAPNTFAPALDFSPDGRWLVYARNDRIAIDLFIGEAQPVAAGPAR